MPVMVSEAQGGLIIVLSATHARKQLKKNLESPDCPNRKGLGGLFTIYSLFYQHHDFLRFMTDTPGYVFNAMFGAK
jgi:hypothetical protein